MSDEIRPRRSTLYMPGSNARALEKAKTLAADALILDLEDAVAPAAKAAARDQVKAAVAAGGYRPREVVIRINALSTEWGRDDLDAALAAGPDAILVPKVSSAGELDRIRAAFAAAGSDGRVALWIMMETPLAILNAATIAAGAADRDARLACLVMGTNDLAKETGASLGHGRFAMVPWLATCVAAARANGLAILDGVYNDIRDAEGFAAECAQGAALGMDGKTLIHPSQVPPANEIFAPAPAEIERARAIIAAFSRPENEGKGAIELDGRMVELLHLETARRTMALAAAIAATL
ncbi:MAG: CoA ester lyase [Hyphomicrobiales bacterium]|nr:CoA ester lyase [Hyphomicrobiales bacterium]